MLRYGRIDDFWFTLMHELAHVGLHLEDNVKAEFFKAYTLIVTDFGAGLVVM